MKLFRGGILFGLLLSFGSLAEAQYTFWTGNSTGDFDTYEDWTNGTPNATGPNAYIITGALFPSETGSETFTGSGITTYTITFDSATPSTGTFVLTAQAAAPTGVVTGAGDGTINLELGTSTLTVAGTGAVTLTGTDYVVTNGATVNLTGGETLIQSGLVSVGNSASALSIGYGATRYADQGTGALNISSGKFDYSSSTAAMYVGVGASASGTFTQSGTAIVTGNETDIGNDGGTGVYNLQAGSFTTTTGLLGVNAKSSGTFTQTGGTSDFTMSLTVGVDNTGLFTLTSGTATLGGTLDLGLNANSSGTFTEATGSMLTVAGVTNIGDAGTGTLTLTGGTGTFTGGLYVGKGVGTGSITESGGALNANGGMFLGFDSNATYTLSGGTSTINGINIGQTTGVTGTFNQTGGTLIISVGMNDGLAGDGSYSISGGGATINGQLSVGTGAGTGTLTIAGGTLALNGPVTIGALGTVTQSGGAATVQAGSTIDLNNAAATYNLNGGTLNVSDDGIVADGINGAGTFNFGGGTLQAGTSNPLTDNLDGTVTGNSTLDATNNNITLGGNLTGSGGFTVIGGNNVNLTLSADATTAAAYTGATVIDGGNLVLNSPDGTDVFASAISGTSAGTLTINPTLPTATVRLPGTLDFLGTTTLNNTAYLNVYNGTLGNVAGTNGNLIVGQDGTQGTYGAGGAYTYPTTGTVSLTGTNSYTGSTQVYNGFTLYASNLATTTMTNNGTFGNNGTVGTNISIAGPYNQPQQATSAAEGTLLVRVAGNTADSFSATSATLYGTVGVSGYSAIGTTAYNIFNTAPAGLTTGTLNSATASGLASNVKDSTLLSAVLSFSPAAEVTTPTTGETNLYLIVTQLPFSQFALTPNQVAVANALDAALVSPSANDTLFAGLDSLSAAQIPDVLDQLSPRSYLYMRDLAFDNSTFLAENMHTRMESMREGFSGVDTSGLSIVAPGLESPLGRSLGSMLAYNGEGVAPNGVNYYPQDETAPPYAPPASSLTTPEESARTISDSPTGSMAPTSSMPSSSVFNAPNFSEFISGDLILADLKQDQSTNNIPEAHYTAADATAGIGFKITPHLVGGVLFDYNHTDARTDGQGSHVRVDTYSPGAFATVSAGGLYLDGLFTFGYNDYSNDRKINIGGTSTTATSSPSGEQYVGDVDLGYNFHPDHEGHWALGPEAGLEYVHLDVDSFTESGAGLADLSVNSQSADSLRGRLGGRLSYFTREGAIVFAPTVFASYQHEFLNDPFGLTSQFNIPSSTPFTIQGTNPGRDSALIGIGASATFDNAMSIYLNYLAEVGANDYFVQSVQGGLRASF
jgi:uncharacterized protein with beta-barrel porin domain